MRTASGPPGPSIQRWTTEPTGSGAPARTSGWRRASCGVSVSIGGRPATASRMAFEAGSSAPGVPTTLSAPRTTMSARYTPPPAAGRLPADQDQRSGNDRDDRDHRSEASDGDDAESADADEDQVDRQREHAQVPCHLH